VNRLAKVIQCVSTPPIVIHQYEPLPRYAQRPSQSGISDQQVGLAPRQQMLDAGTRVSRVEWQVRGACFQHCQQGDRLR
jgi:hypothetical protein